VPNRRLFACFLLWLNPAVPVLHAQLRSETDTRSLSLPAIGDCTLRILSPSLLEFTRITASAEGPPEVPDFQVTSGGRTLEIVAVGRKRRVAYAPLATSDLRISTEFYIRLALPVDLRDASETVAVRDPAGTPGSRPVTAMAAFDPHRYSPAIHVNQEGYAPSLPKKAMIGYYLGDMGEMEIPASSGFALIDARTGETVYTGSLAPRRDIGYRTVPAPYQKVLEADFGDFEKPGEYRLLVPGLGTSLSFLIDDGIAMGFARTYALGLYGQRCGTSNDLPYTRFTHGACHTALAQIPDASDPQFAFTWATIAGYSSTPSADNPPQLAPAAHERGHPALSVCQARQRRRQRRAPRRRRLQRYTINSAELIHYLVFAVDSIPGVATLDNLGIPESGDGISDVLEEAKWEADYLAKLQDGDGGFYFLVYPRDSEYESNVLPDHGDPQVVWPKNTSATAAAVAALAQCASSPEFKRHFPEAAAQYLRQAMAGWRFLMAPSTSTARRGPTRRSRSTATATPTTTSSPGPPASSFSPPATRNTSGSSSNGSRIPPTRTHSDGAGGACPESGATRSEATPLPPEAAGCRRARSIPTTWPFASGKSWPRGTMRSAGPRRTPTPRRSPWPPRP
jgi:hypothetical protein